MSASLPSGYTQLEYIQSSGTQYIDTGIIPTTFDYEIETKVAFGDTGGGPKCAWGFMNSGSTYPRWLCAVHGTGYLLNVNTTSIVGTPDTNVHIFLERVYNNGTNNVWDSYIDGVVANTPTTVDRQETWTANTLSIYFGARNNSNAAGNFAPSGTKYYHMYIKKAGTFVRKFIPAKRDSDNAIGMYDFISNTFYTSATSTAFVAGPATSTLIKVATTKYVEEQFADSVSELNTTIGTIKNVVDNTIIQADRIGKLHTGKQTRPAENCPDGAQCLLITEADGSLHWYPICNADGSVGTQSSSSFDVSAFIAAIPTTAQWGDEYYYRQDRNTGTALKDVPASNLWGQSTDITLSAGEWRLKKNGTGTIYGTSACSTTDNGKSYAQTGNPGTTLEGGTNCWCKMTRIEDANGNGDDTDGALWVYHNEIGSSYNKPCAYYCSEYCVYDVWGEYESDFRGAVLGTSD